MPSSVPLAFAEEGSCCALLVTGWTSPLPTLIKRSRIWAEVTRLPFRTRTSTVSVGGGTVDGGEWVCGEWSCGTWVCCEWPCGEWVCGEWVCGEEGTAGPGSE